MDHETDGPTRTRGARWQSIAGGVLLVCGVLGLGASTGFTPLPRGAAYLAPFLHPFVAALGFVGGLATVFRAREIDRERWILVEDETLTAGERRYAHREADRNIRVAGTVFLLASISVGGWLAYQLKDPEQFSAAELLIVSPAVGFMLGLPIGARRWPAEVRDP